MNPLYYGAKTGEVYWHTYGAMLLNLIDCLGIACFQNDELTSLERLRCATGLFYFSELGKMMAVEKDEAEGVKPDSQGPLSWISAFTNNQRPRLRKTSERLAF